jgi:hypothetical protein
MINEFLPTWNFQLMKRWITGIPSIGLCSKWNPVSLQTENAPVPPIPRLSVAIISMCNKLFKKYSKTL